MLDAPSLPGNLPRQLRVADQVCHGDGLPVATTHHRALQLLPRPILAVLLQKLFHCSAVIHMPAFPVSDRVLRDLLPAPGVDVPLLGLAGRHLHVLVRAAPARDHRL